MLRAVLDPGVLIAALLSRDGSSARLLEAWRSGELDLVVSAKLLGELERVLRRPKFRRWIDERDVAPYVELFRRGGVRVDDPPDPPRATPDPGDDCLVALALAAAAHVLVSGDAHLLGLPAGRIPVLSPRELLDRLERGYSAR